MRLALLGALFAFCGIVAVAPPTALAATAITVSSTADTLGTGPAGTCTLRDAIVVADEMSNPALIDPIAEPGGSGADGDCTSRESGSGSPYTIALAAGATYVLTTIDNYWFGADGLPPISADVTIVGNGSTITRASSAPPFRLFYVAGELSGPSTSSARSSGSLSLTDLTLSGGLAQGGSSAQGGGGAGMGGAIFDQGQVSLSQVTLSGNTAQGGSSGVSGDASGGGGIGSDAPVTGAGAGFGGSAPGATGGGGGAGGAGGGGGGGGFVSSETGSGANANQPGFGGGYGQFGSNQGDGGDGGGSGSHPGADGGGFGQGGLSGGGDGGGGGIGGGGGATAIAGAAGGGGGFGGGGAAAGAGGAGGAGGFGGGGGLADASGAPGAGGYDGGAGGPSEGGGGAGMGGAIFALFGQLTISDSTIAGNAAIGGTGASPGSGIGGAIANVDNSSNTSLQTSPISGSTIADNQGGGMFSLAFGNNPSLQPNSAGYQASSEVADFSLDNSIVYGNSTAAHPGNDVEVDEVDGDWANASHGLLLDANIVGTSDTQSGPQGGTSFGGINAAITSDPQLGALTDNGGSTTLQTMKPDAGSPALGAGLDDAVSSNYTESGNGCDPVDELGNARPDPQCDLGALEVTKGGADLTATKTDSVAGVTNPGSTWAWTIHVANAGDRTAAFSPEATILTDDLPDSHISYGSVTVTGSGGFDPSNVICQITSSDTLTCSAPKGGEDTGLAATFDPGASFDVTVPVTESGNGTFANPRDGGVCAVDPEREVPETAPNQTCSDTVFVAEPPTATITNPADGSSYDQGQVVDAGYSCQDGTGGPGIASCTGPVADGQPIDTSSLGHRTFTVTATSSDGRTGSASVGYTVVAAASSGGSSPSPSSPVVAPLGGAAPPTDITPPTITGGTRAGDTLGCSAGTWTGQPTRYVYGWERDGTPIVGVTASHYTVETEDEGLTITCTVTAANGAGSSSPATSAGVSIPVPRVPRCPAATGALNGAHLGLVRLGMTRVQARRAYSHSSDRGKRYEDFFCLTPTGVRVGLASPKLIGASAADALRAMQNRVVWVSTSSRYYAINGIRPGATLAAAQRQIKLGRVFQIGLNDWYLGSDGASTAVLKVRHGIVEEIGIADKRLTGTRTSQRIFLRSFY